MGLLTPELEKERVKIEKVAREAGLDFFETIFELVNFNVLNQVAARGGFPVRYPHWKWGMDYEQLSKSYEYGLSKIYELVINTDPCYAYLMEGNEFLDQKLVMAHVFGHCDFFKNNQWFSKTDRKMMDTMANHAVRVSRYMDRFGIDVVEGFIDSILSIEYLIDRYQPYRSANLSQQQSENENNESNTEGVPPAQNIKPYMESFRKGFDSKQQTSEEVSEVARAPSFPEQPESDVLLFLIHHAPLNNWQQDILSMIRDESYYFSPQGMTKIMNEGWASYWHSKLMTEKIMNDSEIIDFADRHSGTMAMSPMGFNPYKVGIELMRDVEKRWDRGQFGLEWSRCDDLKEKKNWDTKAGLGREKIFEVRRNYNDITFVDEFLTEEFCIEHKMFVYNYNKKTQRFELDTRNFPLVKKKLLFQLTNMGQPIIKVLDGNFKNRGELLLGHLFEGIEMQANYMRETLQNLYKIWGRPVNLASVMDNEPRIFSFDGKDHSFSALSKEEVQNKSEEEDKSSKA